MIRSILTSAALSTMLLLSMSGALTAGESMESIAPYSQLITVQAGPFHPASITLSNGSYAFDYNNDSLDSYLVEVGWSAHVYKLLGSWSLEENLAFSSFSGALAPVPGSPASSAQTLSAYMMGLDSRLMWSWDWFPWHSLIPFFDAGGQYTFFYQSGSSELQSSQGGVGNFVTGAGLRLWLNRATSLSDDHINRFAAFPLFLTAKVNHIFSSDNGVNLGSTDFMAGISVGL
jgi:hypothetical protein